MVGHHQKGEIGRYFITSAILKIFLVEIKLCTLFPLCPFNSFGRGQPSWALKYLEGHSVHEFVLALISVFFILFYPLPRGHFDWHRSQVKRSADSKGHVCHSSVRITFSSSDEIWLPSPVLCFWEICSVSLARSASLLAYLIQQHHLALSDPETWCQCPRIHLNMVTTGLRLTGDYDWIYFKP